MKRIPKKVLTKGIQQQLRGETPRERLLHRLHSVVLVLSGYSASEAGRIHGDSPRAVAYWVNRFNDKGMAGLEDDQRPGRPSKLDEHQIKKLQIFLKQAERKSESINAERASAFILSEFGVSLTARQCWRILNKLKS
jgi:transposase